MNKLWVIGVLVAVFLTLVVLAQAIDEEGLDYNGAPDWDFVKAQLGIIDRIRVSQTSLTIVNGALCSINADWSKQSILNSNSICWNNRDGGSPGGNGIEHIGVAYQVFNVNPWNLIKEIQIPASNKGCVDITPNKEYYRQAFYCDDVSRFCTDFASLCYTDTGTRRERTCSDRTGGNVVTEIVEVSWQIPNDKNRKNNLIGLCVGFEPEPDPSTGDADAGQDGSGQGTSTGLKGSYITESLRHVSNVRVGQQFVVVGTFKAETAGRYYLEAGVQERQLAIIATGSKCDGSKQFAGEFVDLNAGESVDMRFNIIAPGTTGIKTLIIGAYSGCLNEGGEVVSKVTGTINVLTTTGQSTIGEDSKFTLTNVAIVGGFTIGLALIGSVVPGIGTIIGTILGMIIGIIIVVMI